MNCKADHCQLAGHKFPQPFLYICLFATFTSTESLITQGRYEIQQVNQTVIALIEAAPTKGAVIGTTQWVVICDTLFVVVVIDSRQ